MIHGEIRDLLPAYALDALGPIDRLEVRSHLEVCSSCDELAREYLGSASDLALTVEPMRPARGLRRRVNAEIAAARQVLPIGLRDRRRRIPRGAILLAGTTVLLLGAMGGLVTSRVAGEDRFIPEVVSLLSSPNVNAIAMTSTGEDPDASGQVFMPDDAHAAAVIMTGLDDPGSDVYQLSVVLDGATVPVRTFQPDRSGMAVVVIRRNLAALEGVVVTLESTPGAKTPSGRRLVLKS